MGHWLADVHLAGFAPAFTLSFHDSECSRKPPNAHSLGRWQQAEKKKKNDQDEHKLEKLKIILYVNNSNGQHTSDIVLSAENSTMRES